MKNLLFVLMLSMIAPVVAADKLEVEFYGGAVSVLGFDGSQAGLRVIRPLNCWLSAGVDMAMELDLSNTHWDGRTETGSFLRAHVLLKMRKQFKRFEPYVIGSIGKDIIGQNPIVYSRTMLKKVSSGLTVSLEQRGKLALHCGSPDSKSALNLVAAQLERGTRIIMLCLE